MGYICDDCSSQNNQNQFYCSICSPRWHQNFCDHEHDPNGNNFDTGTLQLLSVLCNKASHYVCFTRITGSGKDEWVFFDSMAERQGNTTGCFIQYLAIISALYVCGSVTTLLCIALLCS